LEILLVTVVSCIPNDPRVSNCCFKEPEEHCMLPIDKTMGIGILKTSRIHLIDKSHVEIIVMHYIRKQEQSSSLLEQWGFDGG